MPSTSTPSFIPLYHSFACRSTMAAELGFLSMSQIQKLAQYQNSGQIQHPAANPNSLTTTLSYNSMWNRGGIRQEDDDSWEVRAFAEDTNGLGSTWPPRFYSCTFCRREFRSAQALGGHMNVHRRDRARLHQAQPSSSTISSPSLNSSLAIPAQEFVPNGGLCFFYGQLPKPSNTFTPIAPRATISSSSKFLTLSQQPTDTLISPSSTNFSVAQTTASNSSYRYCGKTQEASVSSEKGHEELDLELRLGHRRRPA